jgi:hypothetical protein
MVFLNNIFIGGFGTAFFIITILRSATHFKWEPLKAFNPGVKLISRTTHIDEPTWFLISGKTRQ